MEQRERTSNPKSSRIEEKLDKLADDIKKLPDKRKNKLKELLDKRAHSSQEAAVLLGISFSTLRRLMKSGEIKFFRVGRGIRISAEEIERLGNSVTLQEAADILGVHSFTIRRLIKSGKLRAHRIGRPYRIARSDLELLMKSETKGSSE